MEPSKAGDLQAHLTRTITVKVKDVDETEWSFKIRRVGFSLWDKKGDWTRKWRDSPDGFLDEVKAAVGSPDKETLKNVLVMAVRDPELSPVPKDGAVWANDLVSRDVLSLNLYAEIINFSFKDVLKAEVIPDASTARGSDRGR